jgi:YVTN family beta-propeller protein
MLSRVRIAPFVVAVAGLVGLAPPPPAAAVSSAPAPYVLTTRIQVGMDARMVDAAGKLFVSSGSEGSSVRVYSPAGTLLDTIADQPGAEGLVVSPDGGTVYVAQSTGDAISAIDTTTYAVTALSVGSDVCPTNLALAAGRLFFSYGCSAGADTSSVANVDPVLGGTPVEDAFFADSYAPPLLAGAGDVLASLSVGQEPASVQTFTAAVDGSITQLGSTSEDNGPRDLALSSDGSHLYLADGSAGFTEFGTSGTPLTQEKAYNANSQFTTAVALSPTGTRLAGGLLWYGSVMNLYSTSASTPIWQRLGASTSPTTWTNGTAASTLPGTVAFSADGSEVFGLVSAPFSKVPLLFTSGLSPSATTMHLAVKSTNAMRPVSATATMSGRGTVVFRGTSNGKSALLGSVATNAKGVATLRFRSPFDGTVHAVFYGSLTRYPASAQKSFKIASKTTLKMSGFFANRHGVRWFHSTKDVRLLGTVTPAVDGRGVRAQLQYYIRGKWRVVGTLDDSLMKNGTVKFRLGGSASRTLTRIELKFRGDRLNTGSVAFSPRFEIS